jgi:hypothetical protein
MAMKKKKLKKKMSVTKRKAAGRNTAALRKKASGTKKAIRRKKIHRRRRFSRAETPFDVTESPSRRGLGGASAGQSGDTQGLSRSEDVDSESVEELAEEGQSFEAEVVSGVETALDPDQGELRVREEPELKEQKSTL